MIILRFFSAKKPTIQKVTDPVLPAELLPTDWPGDELRTAYTDFAAELVERRDARLRDAQLMEAT